MKKEWMLLVILVMGIGFAAISTALYINGTAIIQANEKDFHVYYSDAYVNGEQNLDVITDDTTISFETTLSNIGDIYELKYEVTNGSTNYDADLEMVCTGGNDYLKVYNDFDDETDLISQDSRMGVLTLELVKSYTGEDLKVSIDCEINANAVERNSLVDGVVGDTEIDNPPINFGQVYSFSQPIGYEDIYLEYAFVFSEEGKATMFINGVHESNYVAPMFDVAYYEDRLVMTEIYDYNMMGEMVFYYAEDNNLNFSPDPEYEMVLTQGSIYDIPVEIDIDNSFDYPVVTSLGGSGYENINIPAKPEFEGNFELEFYNLKPTANTDTSKHNWSNNKLLIANGDFDEEYNIELELDLDGSGGTGMTGGFLTSSGFYWITIVTPDGYVWEP